MAHSVATIEELADFLRLKKNGRSQAACHLLIGAGCSVSGGVPLASTIVANIKNEYPGLYARARRSAEGREPTYSDCMRAIEPATARDLIGDYCDKAKINSAHFVIARLIADKLVERVYTTNFDPLVARACAFDHNLPAIYDLALAKTINAQQLSTPCILHLHGQRHGFRLLHVEEELEKNAERLVDVFDNKKDALWIVVGYSGEQDPVIKLLSDVERFERGLFWVGYHDGERDHPPANEINRLLLDRPGNNSHLIVGYDADRFFIELGRRLDCYPPPVIERPFTYLKSAFAEFEEPTARDAQHLAGWIDRKKRQIAKTVQDLDENEGETIAQKLHRLLIDNNPADVIGQFHCLPDRLQRDGAIRNMVYWAHIALGNAASDLATSEDTPLSEHVRNVSTHYDRALTYSSNAHEAYYNWGTALAKLANRSTNQAQAAELLQQAADKFKAALRIKPDKHEALYNWGNALSDLAQRAEDQAEAINLLRQACVKFDESLQIKPDRHEALYNWGNALGDLARRTRDDAQAIDLLLQACAKYEEALRIKPDKHEALNNLGIALIELARCTENQAESIDLLRQACAKYEGALRIKPDKDEAYFNWSNALAQLAIHSKENSRANLMHDALDKARRAVALLPSDVGILSRRYDALGDGNVAALWRMRAERAQIGTARN